MESQAALIGQQPDVIEHQLTSRKRPGVRRKLSEGSRSASWSRLWEETATKRARGLPRGVPDPKGVPSPSPSCDRLRDLARLFTTKGRSRGESFAEQGQKQVHTPSDFGSGGAPADY